MLAHELAKELLQGNNVEVTCSIDISTGDCDFGRRVYGSELSEVMLETSGGISSDDVNLITLLFSSGYDNNGY